MGLQVVQYRSDPDAPWDLAVEELMAYRKWIPKRLGNVLDLSSGLGRTSAMLDLTFSCGAFYLLDRSEISDVEEWIGEYDTGREEWCNDLAMTAEFCRANMRSPHFILDMDSDWESRLPTLDLVISTLAVGFHWPLLPWLERLHRFGGHETVAIFGVRSGVHEDAPEGWKLRQRVETGAKQEFSCFDWRPR